MRLLAILACSTPVFACQTLDADRIFGKDLAAASAQFASIDPELAIGAAPLAGVTRVMHTDELVRIARNNGLTLGASISEVCFQRDSEVLTKEKILPVLTAALASDAATIEILDFSRMPVPHGTLEFRRAGLSENGQWLGRVVFGEGRSAAVWARVRVRVESAWVEAAEPLAAGKTIEASQVVRRVGPRFPFGTAPVDSLDLVIGKIPTRAIAAGASIFPAMLTTPREVSQGDRVQVAVISGAALLAFEATAGSSGRLGESILVRNPENGKLFQARVEGKGKVTVKK